MAENSKIEWTDHTFNPWVGCTKVSPACDHCYAEGWAKRAGKAAGVVWGGERRRTSESTWRQPLKWERAAALAEAGWRSGLELANGDEAQLLRSGFVKPRRPRVFCASLADVFDNQVPTGWRVELLATIGACEHLDWLLLTKRVGNVTRLLCEAAEFAHAHGMPAVAHWITAWVDGEAPPNVWLGATLCNQDEFDRDVSKLDTTPAAVRFLSIEPMLGPIVDRDGWLWGVGSRNGIDWVICGGESGPKARPMHPDWARSLRDQCAEAGVPFLFKQWGEWLPGSQAREIGNQMALVGGCDHGWKWDNGTHSWKIGKKAAGRMLDGRTHDEFPGA